MFSFACRLSRQTGLVAFREFQQPRWPVVSKEIRTVGRHPRIPPSNEGGHEHCRRRVGLEDMFWRDFQSAAQVMPSKLWKGAYRREEFRSFGYNTYDWHFWNSDDLSEVGSFTLLIRTPEGLPTKTEGQRAQPSFLPEAIHVR